jgi:hypothetical protein
MAKRGVGSQIGKFDSWSLKIRCCNPTLKECEDDIHTPEMGTWESSRTLENLEFNCRDQNTSPWGVPYTIEKVLKPKNWKWPRMNHSDICSINHMWKKGRESTQSRCVQAECNTPLEKSRGELQVSFRPHPDRRFKQGVMSCQSPRSPNRDSFGTVSRLLLGSPKKKYDSDVGAAE